ncbi:hypothetical protein Fot_41447 [Forsythia ovata]|uniref:Uncharacterized protein n=1 Tax=Forsythia ovata TaxID=205694 RepID=A0ABD1RIB4_9LAMI
MEFPIDQIIGGGLMLQKVSTEGENVEHHCDDEQRIVGGYLRSDGQLPSILVQLDGECKNMERQNCDKGVVYRNSVLDNRSHGRLDQTTTTHGTLHSCRSLDHRTSTTVKRTFSRLENILTAEKLKNE